MTDVSRLPSSVFPAGAAQPAKNHALVYFEVGVPHELRDAVERHHRNLNALADRLRQAGMAENEANACIDVAIASYRAALESAATAMRSSSR